MTKWKENRLQAPQLDTSLLKTNKQIAVMHAQWLQRLCTVADTVKMADKDLRGQNIL